MQLQIILEELEHPAIRSEDQVIATVHALRDQVDQHETLQQQEEEQTHPQDLPERCAHREAQDHLELDLLVVLDQDLQVV